MGHDLIGDATSSLLNTYVTTMNRRTEVVVSNLANADTPGYQTADLDFAEHLQRAASASQPDSGILLAATHPKHFPLGGDLASTGTVPVIHPKGLETGNDGNNVDADQEMAKLAETGLRVLTGTQLMQSRLRLLRTAIKEGR